METSVLASWIATAVCLLGTVLNVKRSRLCFVLWTIGNILWLLLDAEAGKWPRALLDTVQFKQHVVKI